MHLIFLLQLGPAGVIRSISGRSWPELGSEPCIPATKSTRIARNLLLLLGAVSAPFTSFGLAFFRLELGAFNNDVEDGSDSEIEDR